MMGINKFISRVRRKYRAILKDAYQAFVLKKPDKKKIVFIIGCQRSGTTMLTISFEADARAKVYSEVGKIMGNPDYKDDSHRIKSFDEVEKIIEPLHASIIVGKPLVDSQNILRMFDYFPGSRAIWSYRNYRPVVNSYLVLFGYEIAKKNLRRVLYYERDDYWCAENLSDDTKDIVKKYYSEDMLPQDAAALFWYIRNILFFELGLDKNDRVITCKYEDIVVNPKAVTRKIYEFLDVEYPGDQLVKGIHTKSVGLGKDIELSPELKIMCDNLIDKLDTRNRQYYGKI